ncbi:MAG: hypothetical protein JO166_24875, partial [Deltaproteobacteria bacterium]|nr:hypothetical protein [Deltaproteobacteria bacterium]
MILTKQKIKKLSTCWLALLLIAQGSLAAPIQPARGRDRMARHAPARRTRAKFQPRLAQKPGVSLPAASTPKGFIPELPLASLAFTPPAEAESLTPPAVEALIRAAEAVPSASDSAEDSGQPASSSPKIAPDLLAEVARGIQAGKGDDLVRIIVQTDGSGIPVNFEGRTVGTYPSFKMAVVEVALKDVASLAGSPGVRALSPDRVVSAFQNDGDNSYLRRATGVREALQQPNLRGLDGSGVGIAILDSGVQVDHNGIVKGKTDDNQMVSISFVSGDAGVNDLYGHGTHV